MPCALCKTERTVLSVLLSVSYSLPTKRLGASDGPFDTLPSKRLAQILQSICGQALQSIWIQPFSVDRATTSDYSHATTSASRARANGNRMPHFLLQMMEHIMLYIMKPCVYKYGEREGNGHTSLQVAHKQSPCFPPDLTISSLQQHIVWFQARHSRTKQLVNTPQIDHPLGS